MGLDWRRREGRLDRGCKTFRVKGLDGGGGMEGRKGKLKNFTSLKY